MEMAKLEVAILATDYTNNVLAIRVTNIPVLVRGTPAVPVWPVTANIINVYAQVVTVGMVAVVLFLVHQVINIHAPVPAMQVAQAMLAVENTPPAPALADMDGTGVAAVFTALKVICIIAMAKLLVYVLQVWASMLR